MNIYVNLISAVHNFHIGFCSKSINLTVVHLYKQTTAIGQKSGWQVSETECERSDFLRLFKSDIWKAPKSHMSVV